MSLIQAVGNPAYPQGIAVGDWLLVMHPINRDLLARRIPQETEFCKVQSQNFLQPKQPAYNQIQ